MIKVNEYFGGNVRSLGFDGPGGSSTVGVMAPGEYTFSTGAPETITVISGLMDVRLPGSDVWRSFPAGTTFDVGGQSSFDLRIGVATAYLCLFR